VRRPRGAALAPAVKFAVEIAEHYKTKEDVELNLWLIFHPICEALYFRNMQKAKLVDSAHYCYKRAMQWLFLPVAGISLCLLVAMGHPQQAGNSPPPAVQKATP